MSEMMQESGIVTKLYGDTADVIVERKGGCEGCASSKICNSLGDGSVLISARNSINAELGNRVVVSISSRGLLFASAVIYVIPILGLLSGILVGRRFPSENFSPDHVSFFFGILGLVFAVIGASVYSRKLENKSSMIPEITEVL